MDIQYSVYKEDLKNFQEMTERFYSKEISQKEYKGFSGRYGSYAQRNQEASMLRLRMTGGAITKEKLKFIVDSIEAEHIDRIHFTTCQTVQLHNLHADTVSRLMLAALDYHIITWGGGGDYPRNVMVSPLSGVEIGETFDITPYANAAAAYLLSLINHIRLPRKLKVSFSNTAANEPHVTFRDLGFSAASDGTFDVYAAGGLGNNPKMGLCVKRGADPSEILYYIKAMIDTFTTYGNYENRAKSRTRYLQDTLGKEGFIAAFHQSLQSIMDSGENLSIKVAEQTPVKKGETFPSSMLPKRITAQKQEGLYAVSYHPIGGTPPIHKLAQLYDTIKDMEQVELRLTPEQGCYIINCTGPEAQRVHSMTEDGASNMLEASVACIGASICQVGIRDSQKLLRTVTDVMKEQNFADGILPKLHISGCPSSCGTHQIGEIGFHGCVKMIDKVPYPAFTLHVNGSDKEGKECFGEKLGSILEADIPAFLIAVGHAVEGENMTFKSWITSHFPDFQKIADPFLN